MAALDLLPNHHIEGLREIVYAPFGLPGEAWPRYRSRASGHRKGEFRQKERRIVLYEIDSLDLLLHVLHHEIGHFVFFLALNSRVKKRWVTEIFPGSLCITRYGALNASEDFAETYACYARQPDSLQQQLPAKFDFMRDWVFSGKAETLKEKTVRYLAKASGQELRQTVVRQSGFAGRIGRCANPAITHQAAESNQSEGSCCAGRLCKCGDSAATAALAPAGVP